MKNAIYKKIKKEEKEQEALVKKHLVPLTGIAVVWPGWILLNQPMITAVREMNMPFSEHANAISVGGFVAFSALSTLYTAYYKEEINSMFKNGVSLKKKEFFLDNYNSFMDINNSINKGYDEYKSVPMVTYDNIDSFSYKQLEKIRDSHITNLEKELYNPYKNEEVVKEKVITLSNQSFKKKAK